MKKLGFSLVSLGAIASAQAAINFNIDVQYQTVVRPSSGTIQVTFSGTIDVLLPNFDVITMFVEFPGLTPTTDFLVFNSFDSALLTYIGSNAPGVDYSGDLFSFDVSSNTPLGFYWLNSANGGFTGLSEAYVHAGDGNGNVGSDNEIFGVDVVPEPATLGILGIGALALLRRRRK